MTAPTRTLRELLTEMACQSIANHRDPSRRTRTGKPFPSTSFPIDHVLITLPEELMLAVARNPENVPTEVLGVPIRIAEAPSRINKPTGLPMLSTMCKYVNGERLAGSIGRVTIWDGKNELV